MFIVECIVFILACNKKCNFFSFEGYVQEVYDAFLECLKNGYLEKELEELEKMTPEFMNTMMNKQSREDAIKKRDERKAMIVDDVPPTAAGRKTEFINKD